MKTVLAGMKRKGNAPAGVTIRDAFSGKEDQQPDFGVPWLDFGARAYSPSLRRWMVPDPLGEKYYGVNPYDYCNGDPANYVDPEGREFTERAFEDTGVFMITLGNYSLGSLAHELKHAYQFEVGVLSSGHLINGFPFYDKSDELEAYRRGALFGIPFNGVLDKRYDQIQDGPCEVTSLNPDLYSSPVELHKYAQRHHTNFRYNGITYRYYKK